jgi:hypothetical protein
MVPLIMGAVAAAIPAITSLIGELFSSGNRAAAMRLREQAMAEYNIELPPVEEIAYEALDPKARGAQQTAYEELFKSAKEGGLSAGEQARVQQALGAARSQAKGNREAVLQNYAARGMGGSGMELAALLEGEQSAATRGNNDALNQAGLAMDARRGALTSGAQIAGQVRAGDMAEADRRWDANVFNVGQRQQQFQNRMGLADRRAGGKRDLANAYTGQANQTSAVAGGIGQGLGMGLGTVGQYFSNRGYDDDLWNLMYNRGRGGGSGSIGFGPSTRSYNP